MLDRFGVGCFWFDLLGWLFFGGFWFWGVGFWVVGWYGLWWGLWCFGWWFGVVGVVFVWGGFIGLGIGAGVGFGLGGLFVWLIRFRF